MARCCRSQAGASDIGGFSMLFPQQGGANDAIRREPGHDIGGSAMLLRGR